MKTKTFRDLGKLGSDAKYITRPAVIEGLRKYVSKKFLDRMAIDPKTKWRTVHLEVLLKEYESK